MSEVAAYVPRELDRPDLLDPETDSWVAAVAEVAQLAAYIADTAFVPGPLRGNAPAVAATILYGREVGVAPITALQTMHVVNGRVTMAAELQRARVLAAGHDLDVVESTTALCRIRGRRRGSQTWTEVTFAIGDARAAGLLGNPSWQKYPRPMLVARASAELCRMMFPDVTHGMAATEEIDDEAAPSSTTSTAPTPARKVARAPRAAPRPPSSGEVRAVPPAAPPAAAPEPPAPGDDTDEADRVVASLMSDAHPTVDLPAQFEGPRVPTTYAPPELPDDRVPGEVPLPFEVVEEHGEEHPAPVEVIEAAPLVGDEADAREQGRLKGDGPATRPQTRHVMALLGRLGVGAERAERLHIGQALVHRRVGSFSELTVTDAGRMITTLLIALDTDNPAAYLRWLVDEEHRKMDEDEAELGVGDE
jgi:hypothetical protein